MDIANSVLELIGRTPMVRLVRVTEGIACPVIAKVETTNPGGSVKDRPALAMIEAAERDGHLKAGSTIIEPTSGNTGVGLAIVAAQRGYDCIFVMTDKVSPEKVDLLRAYGAEVIVCPVDVDPEDPRSYYSTAERLSQETPDSFRPNQYANPANPLSHYLTTGPEIWEQTGGKVTHFVAGAGTGGTLCGIGKYLKEMNPGIQIIAADPEGSVYSGGDGRPYLVEGVGEDFWPDTYDPSLIDRVISVTDAKSFHRAREVSQKEGLLIGGSCGTAVDAAITVASELTGDEMVVVLLPDSGRGYLSKIFNDQWMTNYGFISREAPTLREVLDSKTSGIPPIVHLQLEDTVERAIATMREFSISQVLIAQGPLPLSAAEVKGVISEMQIQGLTSDDNAYQKKCSQVMKPPLQFVGVGESITTVKQTLKEGKKLLVLEDGRPIGIVSYADVIAYLDQEGGN
ncbi:MAG: cystathionine beta-synthase [Acidimicrobiales bacterium]|jgi:cystathionine beta-synthase|nr:cystathionine beta-synthase [Acidimicrobiales bacterium]MDP6298742.1 cystathionine beta-synthase [Acidimicrobiales bacterium]HJM28021.1 cystathionine beta-synthase [Acidimicrobiales bacterium]